MNKNPKEKPILFQGEMVRAILDGRKTQTRRVSGLDKINSAPDNHSKAVILNDGTWTFWHPGNVDEKWVRNIAYPSGGGFKCPYGAPGERLWVRETWLESKHQDEYGALYFKADHPEKPKHLQGRNQQGLLLYPWKSPRFMPRWASRITLEIINVRVERVQDISIHDAMAEGCRGIMSDRTRYRFDGQEYLYPTPCAAFEILWDKMHGKKYPWSSNPWVFVIEFTEYPGQGDVEPEDVGELPDNEKIVISYPYDLYK